MKVNKYLQKVFFKITGIDSLKSKVKVLDNRCNALADLLYYHEKNFHEVDAGFNGMVQEKAWGGIHGYRYIMHHLPEDWKTTRVNLWKEIFSSIEVNSISTFFEVGANIGANLESIRAVIPNAELNGIEINPLAVRICKERGFSVEQNSVIDYNSSNKYDFVFSRGVLIHIPPSRLEDVMTQMYKMSNKYVLIWENYSKDDYHFSDYSEKINYRYNYSEKSEGFQFWENFAGHFKQLFPESQIIATSPGYSNAQRGDMVWTLFSIK